MSEKIVEFRAAPRSRRKRGDIPSRGTGGTSDGGDGQSKDGRPELLVRQGQVYAEVDEIARQLVQQNRPIYERGGRVWLLVSAGDLIDGVDRRDSRLVLATTASLRDLITRSLDLRQFDERAGKDLSKNCPPLHAEILSSRRGGAGLQPIKAVLNCPQFVTNGRVLATPGYDPATQLYIDIQGDFPRVKDAPTRDDGLAALEVLRGLLDEFPVVGAVNLSVALSSLLSSVGRHAMRSAPLHAITASAAGSGKSYLADLIAVMATGHSAAAMAQGDRAEETEKRFVAMIRDPPPVVLIDNISQPLGFDLLNQAITQERLSLRPLGSSDVEEVPSCSLFLATGNYLRLLGDMTRRTLLCRLDPRLERPEEREFSRRPIDLVRANRARYVHAALTVLRAAHVALLQGANLKPLASFEDYSRTVRSALVWLGEVDPTGSMDTVRRSDPVLEALRTVIELWSSAVDQRAVTVKEVIELASIKLDDDRFGNGELREALLAVAGTHGTISGKRLGAWLSQSQGRIVAGREFVRAGIRTGALLWQLRASVV